LVKIVILNDASFARGGATGLSLLQARMLAERGYETVFAAADDAPNEELKACGVRLYNAGSNPLMKVPPHVAATKGMFNLAIRDMVRKVIAAEDTPDTVYHVHSWSKTLTPAVFGPLQSVAQRVFIHAHDFFLACPNGGFMDYQAMQPCTRKPLSAACLTAHCDKRNYAQKLWRVGRQLVLRSTLPRRAPWGGVLLIHPDMATQLETAGYPANQLVPLRNPATPLAVDRIQAEHNSRFLFLGRVEAEKGIEDLIAAANAAQVELTVVGEGPLREPLAKQHRNVRFTGWLNRGEMLEHAREARALVMPSRYPEPFGLVVAEASLAGLPVILSDTALLGPEVEAHWLGWQCDTRDTAVFTALLQQVANLPTAEIETISKRGRSGTAGLCLTPDRWIDGILDQYARVTPNSVLETDDQHLGVPLG